MGVTDVKNRIQEANQCVLQRIVSAQPVWIDVRRAIDVIPGMTRETILHAGPPIEWERMCVPQKNAVLGALVYEGLAKDISAAEDMVKSGDVRLAPCHEHATVGSMAGVTSASMPVLVVRNITHGNEAFCLIYESPERQRLSFGVFNEGVLQNLKWIEQVMAPVLQAAIGKMGKLNLKPIMSRALTMGDELHSRNFASTALFALELMPHLLTLDFDSNTLSRVADFIRQSDQFFLHFSMAACKATADAAHGIELSSVVTAIARNGVEVGIRISGLGDQWFTGPAGTIHGLYFTGYSVEDSNPDLGDSAITETMGLGAFALAAAPALALVEGNTTRDALKITQDMSQIAIGRNDNFGIPILEGQGAPVGIDIRKVVETGIVPVIDTGIAYREGGQIGVGNARAPMEAFKKALLAFAGAIGVSA